MRPLSTVQHPSMMAAVISQVGVYDMLRYQLFTIGEHTLATNPCHVASWTADSWHAPDQLKPCCLMVMTVLPQWHHATLN